MDSLKNAPGRRLSVGSIWSALGAAMENSPELWSALGAAVENSPELWSALGAAMENSPELGMR